MQFAKITYPVGVHTILQRLENSALLVLEA
jgi:hypothetical protein